MHWHERTLRRFSFFCKLAIKVFFLARRTGAATALDEPMQTTLPEAVLPFFTRLLSRSLSRFFTFIVRHRLGFQKRVTSPRYRVKTDPPACTHSFVSRVQRKHRRERAVYFGFSGEVALQKTSPFFLSRRRDGSSPPPAFLEFYALPFAENPPDFCSTLATCNEGEIGRGCSLLYFLSVSRAPDDFSFFLFFFSRTRAVTQKEALHRCMLFFIRGVVPLKTKSSLRSKR